MFSTQPNAMSPTYQSSYYGGKRKNDSPSPTAVVDQRLDSPVVGAPYNGRELYSWASLIRSISMVPDSVKSRTSSDVSIESKPVSCDVVLDRKKATEQVNGSIKSILKNDLLLLLVSDFVYVRFSPDNTSVSENKVIKLCENIEHSLKKEVHKAVFNAFDEYLNLPEPWKVVSCDESHLSLLFSCRSTIVDVIEREARDIGLNMKVSSYGHEGSVVFRGNEYYDVKIEGYSDKGKILDTVNKLFNQSVHAE